MHHPEHNVQYSAIFFDELTHFTELQFTYLLSRLRSESETSSFVMAAMNPDVDSWVLKWILPWLDSEGYGREDLNGKIKYFVTIDGEPMFGDSREELEARFPNTCYIKNPRTGKTVYVQPKSCAVIFSTIFDNQILLDKNPNYLSELQALPSVERARLLHGNWFARPQGSGHFKREWLPKLSRPPVGMAARAWDKASEEPSEKEWRPDFTASVKMIKAKDSTYCIVGDYHPENCDDVYKGRFRKRAGARDTIIEKQAVMDGYECVQVLPVDPAAAGKAEFQQAAAKLTEAGIIVKPDPMPNNRSKLTKFMPFSSACENGLVSICEATFPDKVTLDQFYKELESFTGERSTREIKDDICDSAASCFNYLAQSRNIPIVTRNQQQTSTEVSNHIDSSLRLQSFDRMSLQDLYN